jgi:hypothetical protein
MDPYEADLFADTPIYLELKLKDKEAPGKVIFRNLTKNNTHINVYMSYSVVKPSAIDSVK